jgi:hypothetical protein
MSDLTLDRLKAWLADEANFARKFDLSDGRTSLYNDMTHIGVRKRFITRNGYSISIQQSGTHYCNNENEVEMWHCPPSPLLALYGNGEDDPYAFVPLEVVAGYIDSLESLPPKETP